MGDLRTTEGEDLPLTLKEKRRRLWRWGLLVLLLLAMILAAGLVIRVQRYVVAPGYVTTERFAEVRPAITGRVGEILVSSGDVVEQGQVLVRLDSVEESAALAQSQSQVRKIEAELARREAEIAEIRRQHQWDVRESRYVQENAAMISQRIEAALRGENVGDGVTAELAALEAARVDVQKARAQLVRREAELGEANRQLVWSISEAELVLENAKSTAQRTEQLVLAKLTSATALEEARLQQQLTEVKLKALQSRDASIFEKELDVLRQELQGREKAVQQAEAQLRRRLDETVLQVKLTALHLQALEETDLTVYDKELAVKREELIAAKEGVKRAEARLAAHEIRAPIEGQVLRYEFVLGELVRPESVLLEIFGGKRQVLKLRIGERYATRVATGKPYRAELAPYRGLQNIYFRGEVQYLRNVIQSEGQNTYRVAYCDFDSRGYNVPPGTTAEARIYYGTSSLWLYMFGLD